MSNINAVTIPIKDGSDISKQSFTDSYNQFDFLSDKFQSIFSNFFCSKKDDKKDDEENNAELEETTKNIEAEKYEYQRAFNDNNYLYELGLKANDGDCNAIKKILSYSCSVFPTGCEAALKLINETKEMCANLVSKFSNGKGMLSDKAKEAAWNSAMNDKSCSSEAEVKQKANETINDILIGL